MMMINKYNIIVLILLFIIFQLKELVILDYYYQIPYKHPYIVL